MRKAIEELLKSETSYRIAKNLGINARTVNRYQNGESPIDNMTFGVAEKLYNYYIQEMGNRNMWEFEKYTVYLEMDLLRFENNDGEIIGYVMNDAADNLPDALNNGANPIQDGWEDGVGNTIDIDGWGESQ